MLDGETVYGYFASCWFCWARWDWGDAIVHGLGKCMVGGIWVVQWCTSGVHLSSSMYTFLFYVKTMRFCVLECILRISIPMFRIVVFVAPKWIRMWIGHWPMRSGVNCLRNRVSRDYGIECRGSTGSAVKGLRDRVSMVYGIGCQGTTGLGVKVLRYWVSEVYGIECQWSTGLGVKGLQDGVSSDYGIWCHDLARFNVRGWEVRVSRYILPRNYPLPSLYYCVLV